MGRIRNLDPYKVTIFFFSLYFSLLFYNNNKYKKIGKETSRRTVKHAHKELEKKEGSEESKKKVLMQNDDKMNKNCYKKKYAEM